MASPLILLHIDSGVTCTFDKVTVASMFGGATGAFKPDAVIQLIHHGNTIFTIPWLDGMTLDEALLHWANLIGGHNGVHRPTR